MAVPLELIDDDLVVGFVFGLEPEVFPTDPGGDFTFVFTKEELESDGANLARDAAVPCNSRLPELGIVRVGVI